MDAQTQNTIATLADMGIIPPIVKQKGPRPAASYRGARRNHVKAHRQLSVWRQFTAGYANHKADVAGRQVIANGAREAAAKAITSQSISQSGLRPQIAAAAAMLKFYRTEARGTRSITRIIRELEKQIRAK